MTSKLEYSRNIAACKVKQEQTPTYPEMFQSHHAIRDVFFQPHFSVELGDVCTETDHKVLVHLVVSVAREQDAADRFTVLFELLRCH